MKKSLLCLALAFGFVSIGFSKPSQHSIVLRDKCPLYVANSEKEGFVDWKMNISAGEEILTDEADLHRFRVVGDKAQKEYSMVSCTYGGKDYYLFKTNYKCDEKNLAVVKCCTNASAVLYTLPDFAYMQSAFLPFGTTVARLGNVVIDCDGSSAKFSKIWYWDAAKWTVRSAYVRSDCITDNRDSVRVASMLWNAESIKDYTAKRELLSNATELNPEPPFTAVLEAMLTDVNEALLPIQQKFAEHGFESFSGDFTVQAGKDSLNVRFTPGDGDVMGKLPTGTAVKADAVTVDFDTVDSKNARWYRITADVDGNQVTGWVYGGYLAPVK